MSVFSLLYLSLTTIFLPSPPPPFCRTCWVQFTLRMPAPEGNCAARSARDENHGSNMTAHISIHQSPHSWKSRIFWPHWKMWLSAQIKAPKRLNTLHYKSECMLLQQSMFAFSVPLFTHIYVPKMLSICISISSLNVRHNRPSCQSKYKWDT